MPFGIETVMATLDARGEPLQMFVRDDDAGWDDARLRALLDCTERAGVPIDLAVIPDAIGDGSALALCARIDASGGRIGVHQHGFGHANHESAGRRCEFGASRDIALQRRDLIEGRERLRRLFGRRLDAIFTPPWNRCSRETPGLLRELGFAALSRDRGAQPAQRALPELAIDIDWCKLRRAPVEADAIAVALAQRIGAPDASREPLGLMLHHAQMDDRELSFLGEWLGALSRHRLVRWCSMRSLIAVPTVRCAGAVL